MPSKNRCSEATFIWTVFIFISINSPILVVNGSLNAVNVEVALAVRELFDRLRCAIRINALRLANAATGKNPIDEFRISSVPIDEFG
jgi:hypothetical protein